MKKPEPQMRTTYEYNEMADYINEKYNINIRDYASKEVGNRIAFNLDQVAEWGVKHYPQYYANPVEGYRLNQAGLDFCKTKEGIAFFNKINSEAEEARKNGIIKFIPYQDFWHCLCDYWDVSNGCTRKACWSNMKEYFKEDWQKEICDLFITEFGDDGYDIHISW